MCNEETKWFLEDPQNELDPENFIMPEGMGVIDVMAGGIISEDYDLFLQGLGQYDNIGLSFTKETIGDYLSKYSNIPRALSFSVLHNSGTAASGDRGLDTVKSFHAYHLSKGWRCIGYHWVISTKGIIYAARKMEWIGAHAGSNGNPGSIGICLIGNFAANDKPTQAQKDALSALHFSLHKRFYGNASKTIRFHKEFMSTSCPGKITVDEVMGWMKETPAPTPNPNVIGIFFDDIRVGEGVLLDSSTYFKVRDMEKAGYNVEWKEKERNVYISKEK